MTVIYPETPGDGSGPRLRPTLDMFLTARYDELEQLATAAAEHRDVGRPNGPEWRVVEIDYEGISVWPASSSVQPYENQTPITAHMTQHDPAYVLADIAAKRHILELHYSWNLQAERMADPILQTQVSTAEAVLRVLARPFAAHPDFREEWRP